MLDLLIRIAENVIILVGGPSLEEGTVMGALPASSTTTPDADAGREADRTGVRGLAGAVGRGGPVSDREPVSGLTVWIALRRAHEGGVANLDGRCWLDSGRRVPGYVADALDRLTSTGLLALGEEDPKFCRARRITVTDAGCAHYVALCQVHHPNRRAAVGTPQRWARSPHDQRSHLLTVGGTDQIGVLVGVCGHRMLWSVPTSAQPTGHTCPTCEALPGVPVPAPQFGNSPDSGRPPVERSPRSVPAPAGRPDTTGPVTSARRVAGADRGARPPGGHEPRGLGVRRGSPRVDQAVGEDLATAVRPIGDQPARR